MTNMTQDALSVMWAVTEGTNDRYDLYLRGVLMYTNMTFEQFYPLFKMACGRA